MNRIMQIITALCNIQRDKYFRAPEERKKKRKPGTGFDTVLKGEEEKLKERRGRA